MVGPFCFAELSPALIWTEHARLPKCAGPSSWIRSFCFSARKPRNVATGSGTMHRRSHMQPRRSSWIPLFLALISCSAAYTRQRAESPKPSPSTEHAGVITSGASTALRALQEDGAAGYHRWALHAGITSAPHASGPLRERPFFHARGHARLGEIDEAIRCLEQSYEQRECLLVLLKAHEWWDPLRSDPRFTDLVRRVGIP
jgi:hypothetical protein